MNDIENLLRHSIGLHAATIGSSVVEHTVRSRMRRLGLVNHEDYLNLLRRSPAEWNTLIETMVVTETWFFREKQPFAALVRLVIEEWLPAHPEGRLRLLSVPCSSGEEPYSMAMALLDAGFPAARFEISAVDISARALAFAQRAVYGRNSFRGPDLDFRTRHFRPVTAGYALNPAVRNQVRFWRGNFLHENCLAETGVYDFVFCRNLLIYFDRPTQNKTLAKLQNLLTSNGVLFTGSAELPLALENSFKPVNFPLGFACRKSITAKAPGPARSLPQTPVSTSTDMKRFPSAGAGLPAALSHARLLADEGRFAEAAELCEIHIREFGVSAEAFYVLGLVRDAAGADSQAGEFYRKALYLEPGHCETLRQWASLSERNGRTEHARILRERAERRSAGKNPES
ncbi:MAG TPA: protein-glutamate O-methyltransferase CheR [Verrucomicrobiae bacterium]|jgi:chemotaxis protein methyltransferase WspC|nr:protein-glutamate O-methyltransferase CheR [Verrucomicrobiae bacterium]